MRLISNHHPPYIIILFTIISPMQNGIAASQSQPEYSARALDYLLQNSAFKPFFSNNHPKSGAIYNGEVPKNLTGVEVSAVRLRSGSLRRRGFNILREFSIPFGVTQQPYVERIILVYHNLGNWSELYYPLPGFTYLAPVLGLLAYDASNLSAEYVPELDIRPTQDPLFIHFRDLRISPNGLLSPTCVYFGLDGSVEFNSVVNGNSCSTTKQGHFSIAVNYVAPPSMSPSIEPSPSSDVDGDYTKKRRNYHQIWVISGCVIGGGALILLFGVLIVCVKKCRQRKKIRGLEEIAQGGVSLHTKMVMGVSRVPMALGTRTKPVLEDEYVL